MKSEVKSINPDNWMDLYSEYLKAYARKHVSNDSIIEDLVQEAILAALQSRKNYRGEASERTWLTSILRNKIIDHYRRENTYYRKMERSHVRIVDREGIYRLDQMTKSDASHLADYRLNVRELFEVLNEAVRGMSHMESSIYQLKIVQDCTTQEICKKMNISRESCWVTTHRVRKKLSQIDYFKAS